MTGGGTRVAGNLSYSVMPDIVNRTRNPPPFLFLPTPVYIASPDGNKEHTGHFGLPRSSNQSTSIHSSPRQTAALHLGVFLPARKPVNVVTRTNTAYAHRSLFGVPAKRGSFAAEGWASAVCMGLFLNIEAATAGFYVKNIQTAGRPTAAVAIE